MYIEFMLVFVREKQMHCYYTGLHLRLDTKRLRNNHISVLTLANIHHIHHLCINTYTHQRLDRNAIVLIKNIDSLQVSISIGPSG